MLGSTVELSSITDAIIYPYCRNMSGLVIKEKSGSDKDYLTNPTYQPNFSPNQEAQPFRETNSETCT